MSDPWYDDIDRSHWQARIDYEYTIDGMLASIQRAADPALYRGEGALQDYEPYRGDPRGVAVWYVRCVVRKAKGLGLIDEHYQRRAA